MQWKYRDVPVYVPRTADIPGEYRPTGRLAGCVQMVLDNMAPWKMGEDPIETIIDLDDPISSIVVPVGNRSVIWAKHKGHSKGVGLSPFVCARALWTYSFTIVMSGIPEMPILTRAFPGEYFPPLPWHCHRDEEEEAESLEFWRRNAYIYRDRLIVPNSESVTPPQWFSG